MISGSLRSQDLRFGLIELTSLLDHALDTTQAWHTGTMQELGTRMLGSSSICQACA